jgi:hypothetical protein
MAHAVSLSCSPRLHSTSSLPKSHFGVANSGASGFFFSKNAPIAHLNTSIPCIQVRITNGIKSTSSVTAQIKNKLIPSAAHHGHIMYNFPSTFIGIAPLCNTGLSVTFTKHKVITQDHSGNSILKGWHNPEEGSDWFFPLVDEDHNSSKGSLFPSDDDSSICSNPNTPTPPPLLTSSLTATTPTATGIPSSTRRGRQTPHRLPNANDLPGARSLLRKGSRDNAKRT